MSAPPAQAYVMLMLRAKTAMDLTRVLAKPATKEMEQLALVKCLDVYQTSYVG